MKKIKKIAVLSAASAAMGVFFFIMGMSRTMIVSVEYRVVDTVRDAVVTAYTSSPDETDADPFTPADGGNVGQGLVACPREFPFGTMFMIGGEIFRCGDRTSKKYDGRFDVWTATKEEAIALGKRIMDVHVVKIAHAVSTEY